MTTTINASTSAGLVQTADTSGVLALQTANTTAVTIDASQNTTLAGTLTTTGITNSGVATATRFNPTGSSATGNGMYLPAANSLGLSTNGTNAVYIDSSQNVGIGTTSPAQVLEVSNSTNGEKGVIIRNATSGTNAGSLLRFYAGTDTAAILRFPAAHSAKANELYITNVGTTSPITFATQDTERMRIDSSGNLLVGTTSGSNHIIQKSSTSTVLSIINSSATTPNGAVFNFSAAAPNNGTQTFFTTSDTGGYRGGWLSNGGVQNYQGNNSNLSDQREKKNIQLAPNYLDKICQIPVKTFLFNDQTDTDLNLGSIAQDVQAMCPELITESNWGTEEEPKMRLSIYQTDLQYALMKSIQELKAINDTQAELISGQAATINAQATMLAGQSAALAALTARITALEGN